MKRFFIILPACTLLCIGCTGDTGDCRLAIMSWNVQNLFDDIDNGTEYRDFDPGSGEWNLDCFNRKANALADVICSAAAGGPDLIVLQEVENENALRHLNDNCLKAAGYNYLLFLPTEDSAVGNALLSRFPPLAVNSHAVNYGGKVAGRNISRIVLRLPENGEQLILFVNHWKSKLGGAEETEIYRIAAARKLAGLMRDATEEFPGAPVIAAGDFNESHDEWIRSGGEYPTAVTEDGFAGCEIKLFNPWLEYDREGSYFYDGEWETLDQFFLSGACLDGRGWDYTGFATVKLDFNSTAEGRPLAWRKSTGTGCSDHFPVMLELALSGQKN